MSVVQCLKLARQLLEGGWSEPFTRDTEGRICEPNYEGASSFSLLAALELRAVDPAEQLAAWGAVEAVVLPLQVAARAACERALSTGQWAKDDQALLLRACEVVPQTLEAWLEAPGRKLSQVLAMVDRAILVAQKRAAR